METRTLLTINGLQFLFNSYLRFSVVMQKDALVSLAKFLYFCEWKKVISPDFAVNKSLISVTF